MANEISSQPEYKHAVVDIEDNSTVIDADGGQLRGIYVNTTLSAHAVPITDNSVTIFSIPASLAAGSFIDFGDVRFETDLTIDPDNAATGSITVIYKPRADSKNWGT